MQARDVLEAAYAAFAARVREYDDFVAQVTPQLDAISMVSPRVKFPRFGTPTVDGLPLTSCRGASHAAAVSIPAMQTMGTPSFALTERKTLAQGASTIPTS